MPVAEAMERIDSREFAGWRAFYKLDPWDGTRGDYHAALVASTVANAFRGKGRAFTAKDFMPDFDRQEQTGEQMAEIVRASLKALGASNGG